MPYPLSRDEHIAIARYLSTISRQLHDISELFVTRYGKDSRIADLALETLASSTSLEHELRLLENEPDVAETIDALSASAVVHH